jgi:hypothetical protein
VRNAFGRIGLLRHLIKRSRTTVAVKDAEEIVIFRRVVVYVYARVLHIEPPTFIAKYLPFICATEYFMKSS